MIHEVALLFHFVPTRYNCCTRSTLNCSLCADTVHYTLVVCIPQMWFADEDMKGSTHMLEAQQGLKQKKNCMLPRNRRHIISNQCLPLLTKSLAPNLDIDFF